MRDSDRYLMPEGAKVVGRQDDVFEMRITIPSDEHGFFGRQCPSCTQIFRVDSSDYDALPDDLELWCVYCGHHTEHSEFLTQQQLDRAMRAVDDLGTQLIQEAINDAFRGLTRPRSRRRSGFSIEVSHRNKPFYPQPLPKINEEQLIRVRTCATCTLRYAVFGEHRFCPVCGLLPAEVVALDALAAETARLDGLAQLPAEVSASLREQGVFTRIWVDTLENLVGVVEAMTSKVFHSSVTDAATLVKGKGNIFQRLDDTADLFAATGHLDVRSVIDTPTWQRLQEAWATRHLFTHNDGLVDAKYLAKVPGSTAKTGQRLTITEAMCRQAITDTEALCRAIAALTAP
ncbi:hypothetical protein ABZ342_09810 [Amycolatopsis sp. NPDC005961]|uniref:hypothetical protein n=1 Tax=Amycolatopsis sp. NPDC005961 TaxID=3156720 RepID=UPI0033EB078E